MGALSVTPAEAGVQKQARGRRPLDSGEGRNPEDLTDTLPEIGTACLRLFSSALDRLPARLLEQALPPGGQLAAPTIHRFRYTSRR